MIQVYMENIIRQDIEYFFKQNYYNMILYFCVDFIYKKNTIIL